MSMPLLTDLSVDRGLTGQAARMLAAVQLDTLRSLNVCMDICHAMCLQGYSQLKALTLFTPHVKGASAIAQLTGLTQLALWSAFPGQQLFSAAEQSELGSTLAALSNLQSLSISHAPPGPVTQALSQLAALTELRLYQQHLVPNPGPLTLPSCVKLTLQFNISVRQLASINASELRSLNFTLALKPSDLDTLRELCRGVLKACSSLFLDLQHAWSKEDTVDLMAVLSQDWQPFAEALEPIPSGSKGPRQWSLKLKHTHCSRQCLKLLPKGSGTLCLE
jgi:hypothetical protein